MSQSKTLSAVEVAVTTLVGYAVSVAVGQLWLYPLFGYDLELWDNVRLTAIFIIISVFIKYGFRRAFNRIQDRRET